MSELHEQVTGILGEKVIEAIADFVQTEAVDFADWLNKIGAIVATNGTWFSYDKGNSLPYTRRTTAELYQLFKTRKP